MNLHSFIQAFVLKRVVFIATFTTIVHCEPEDSVQNCPDYVVAHAPLIWLHSEDLYRPSDLLTHIQHTTPTVDGQPIPGLPSLDLDNLEILNDSGDQVSLASNDDPTTYPSWFLGDAPDPTGQIHNATPCVVIIVEKNAVELDAFYFYFYSWNEGPNITQVIEPLNRILNVGKVATGMHFGDHVGDWEHNMVRFRDGKPVGIYYSQHVDGKAYKWNNPIISKLDGRPIVYSARGSHANYPTSGDQLHNAALVDYCDEGLRWDPLLSAYFYRFDPTNFALTRLAAPYEPSTSPASNLTSFFYFAGIWGDSQYADSDPRQETVPHVGLKRFLNGPTGPRHKHLVRKGLRPDQRRIKGWKEWSIEVYMSLYPCCLRGWRLWVSLGTCFMLLIGIVLGIRRIIGRFNKGGRYQKLEADDILLDDWAREEEELLFSSSDDLDDDDRERP